MQVLFDLRSPKLVQVQETTVNPLRLVSMLLFCAFVLVSLFNIAYTIINLRDVRAQLANLRSERDTVMAQTARIEQEIGGLRAYKERIKAYVAFSKEEMPSVEFLAALEGAVASSVKLTRLDMKPGNVVIKGVTLGDQDIVDFGNKLGGMKNMVTKISAPVTARTTAGSRIAIEFTIPVDIKSVSEVLAADTSDMLAQDGAAGAPEGGISQ